MRYRLERHRPYQHHLPTPPPKGDRLRSRTAMPRCLSIRPVRPLFPEGGGRWRGPFPNPRLGGGQSHHADHPTPGMARTGEDGAERKGSEEEQSTHQKIHKRQTQVQKERNKSRVAVSVIRDTSKERHQKALLRCVAVRCGAVRCGALRCVALRCDALRCDALRCVAMHCPSPTTQSRAKEAKGQHKSETRRKCKPATRNSKVDKQTTNTARQLRFHAKSLQPSVTKGLYEPAAQKKQYEEIQNILSICRSCCKLQPFKRKSFHFTLFQVL